MGGDQDHNLGCDTMTLLTIASNKSYMPQTGQVINTAWTTDSSWKDIFYDADLRHISASHFRGVGGNVTSGWIIPDQL